MSKSRAKFPTKMRAKICKKLRKALNPRIELLFPTYPVKFKLFSQKFSEIGFPLPLPQLHKRSRIQRSKKFKFFNILRVVPMSQSHHPASTFPRNICFYDWITSCTGARTPPPQAKDLSRAQQKSTVSARKRCQNFDPAHYRRRKKFYFFAPAA